METKLGLFLLSTAGISLTGIMLPGPLTAATISKGYSGKNAGVLIAIGHAVIEIPLIAAIYFGFGHFIGSPLIVKVIYVVGGMMLFYLGFRMLRTTGTMPGQASGLPNSSLVTGIVITATNPAFYLWWATVGMALIAGAATFGLAGVVLFALVHWPCDLIWYEFLSMVTYKSRKWWTKRTHKAVFSICAFILMGFGVWFFLGLFL